MRNAQIKEVMTTSVHSVGPKQTLTFALERMSELHVRHLPVLDGGQLIGIVSDRDLGLIAGLNEVNPDNTAVEEAMTRPVYSVPPTTLLSEVLGTMVSEKVGSALISEGNKVIGIFTSHDAVKLLSTAVSK